VVSLTPWPLEPQGKSPWYPLIGGWVGARACLDILEQKISCPARNWNCGLSGP